MIRLNEFLKLNNNCYKPHIVDVNTKSTIDVSANFAKYEVVGFVVIGNILSIGAKPIDCSGKIINGVFAE